MSKQTFTLNKYHIRLLRSMYVQWQDYSVLGAPEVDPKRPYGNSSVVEDIALILGYKYDKEKGLPKKKQEQLLSIHRATRTALQIVLATGKFKPGTYIQKDEYDHRSWTLLR